MERDALTQYFLEAFQNKSDSPHSRRIGTEYELFIIHPHRGPATYRPLPMEGERGVYQLLANFHEIGKEAGIQWKRKTEGPNLVGLYNSKGQTVTVEPGGQIEFSGAPLQHASDIQAEVAQYLQHLSQAVEPFEGKMLSMGVQPLFSLQEIPIVHKARYDIMFPYMKIVGKLGQYMMKMSSSTQASLDYFDQADLERKFVTLNRLSPFLTAIFANSPLLEGRESGFLSFRGEIWRFTDPHRAGLPLRFLKEDFRLDDYIEWALDASPYFLERDGHLVSTTGIPFRDLLPGKHLQVGTVTEEDWKEHLGMLFPDVRIKKIVEMRGADALLPKDMIAVPVLIKSLVYNDSAFSKLQGLLMDLPIEDYPTYREAAAKQGVRAEVNGVNFLKVARQFFEWALEALGSDEEPYLLPYFEEYTKDGRMPADTVLSDFKKAHSDAWKWCEAYLQKSDFSDTR